MKKLITKILKFQNNEIKGQNQCHKAKIVLRRNTSISLKKLVELSEQSIQVKLETEWGKTEGITG